MNTEQQAISRNFNYSQYITDRNQRDLNNTVQTAILLAFVGLLLAWIWSFPELILSLMCFLWSINYLIIHKNKVSLLTKSSKTILIGYVALLMGVPLLMLI